jgi:hypothetical protein
MEPKKYGREAFIDMCGGTEEAVRTLFPNYVLKSDGLWLDRHAGDKLANSIDLPAARAPTIDLDDLAARRLEAERTGWSWNPAKSSGVPALPFSFTSYQLAALLLAGDGMDLFDYFDFGTVVHEYQLLPLPHDAGDKRRALRADYIAELRSVDANAGEKFEAALRRLGENADDAREVLREAIPLRRLADDKFGRDDEGVRKSAYWLLNDADRETVAAVVTLGKNVPAKKNEPARLLIQEEAWEEWIRWLARGANPTVHSICENLARWCVANEIRTTGNVNPKAGTIRNTMLGAGHWTPPCMSREKAKLHVAQVAQGLVARVAQDES